MDTGHSMIPVFEIEELVSRIGVEKLTELADHLGMGNLAVMGAI